MSNIDRSNASKLWVYRLRTPIWTDLHLLKPKNVQWVKARLSDEDIPRRKQPDLFVNLVRDYPGTFVLPDGEPSWPDTDCFCETDGIDCWLRDFPKSTSNVLKHPAAIERVKTLGTIFTAYRPIISLYLAVKEATLNERYTGDWEEMLRERKSKPTGKDF